jgi:mono/diheme cytochrome c family protein
MKGWSIVLTSIAAVTFVVALEAAPPPEITKTGMTWRQVALADGEQLYAELCAVCHGQEARGDGPAAVALKVATPDLTLLAKRNDGVYPFDDVERAISGEAEIAAHGTLEMPVWGKAFVDLRPDHTPVKRWAFARLRIYDLAAYLETLQAE